MFEWNPSYSVGSEEIDVQHQTLFRLAGELHAAMITGQGRNAMARVLDRLVDYTRVHFAHEETLMRDCGYAEFAAHKTEHDALTKEVMRFQGEFLAGRATMTVQLMQFLKNWLTTHIAGSDAKFVPFVKRTAA